MLTLGSATAAIAVSNPVEPETIAQNQRPNRPGGKEGGMFDQLNLSADQKQKMQAVRDRYKDQISQRMQAVRQARQELGTMMYRHGKCQRNARKTPSNNRIEAAVGRGAI